MSDPCRADKLFIGVLEVSPSLMRGNILDDEILHCLMDEKLKSYVIFAVYNVSIEF